MLKQTALLEKVWEYLSNSWG